VIRKEIKDLPLTGIFTSCSPILDLKPYNPGYYPAGQVRIAGWMEQIYRERKDNR